MSRHRGEEVKEIDEEIVKKLIELRIYLENRIQELEGEAEKLKALFKIVDEVIVSKSFKTAGAISVEKSPSISEKVESVPLKTASGTLLANLYFEESTLRIILVEGLLFKVDTPPFQAFLLSRVLEQMKKRDEEAVKRGEIMPEEVLSYEVVIEKDIIKEIIITNYGDERRLREIRTSSRWTFEKMYEKIRSSD